jgi:hypothetical protein
MFLWEGVYFVVGGSCPIHSELGAQMAPNKPRLLQATSGEHTGSSGSYDHSISVEWKEERWTF